MHPVFLPRHDVTCKSLIRGPQSQGEAMLLDFSASKYVRKNKNIFFINGSDSGIYDSSREQTGSASDEQEGNSVHRKETCTGKKSVSGEAAAVLSTGIT